MIENSAPAKNITPADLTPEQDMLLLAGSKISFRDIYAKEITLRVAKGKYYSTDDVDELFVDINGILTSISEQAYRTNTQLTQQREQVRDLETQLRKLQAENNSLKDMTSNLTQQLGQANANAVKPNSDLIAENEKLKAAVTTAANKLAMQAEVIRQQGIALNAGKKIK